MSFILGPGICSYFFSDFEPRCSYKITFILETAVPAMNGHFLIIVSNFSWISWSKWQLVSYCTWQHPATIQKHQFHYNSLRICTYYTWLGDHPSDYHEFNLFCQEPPAIVPSVCLSHFSLISITGHPSPKILRMSLLMSL